jgi:cytochrome P450
MLGATEIMQWTAVAVATLLVAWLVSAVMAAREVDRKLRSITKVPSTYPMSNLLQLIVSPPWDVIEKWVRQYGSMLRFHFFTNTFVVVADPDVLKHVLATNIHNYQKDTTTTYGPFMCILGSGLVTSHGELWRKQRELISGVFREEILADTAKVAIKATNRLSASLHELHRHSGKSVQIGEEFRKLTLQVIGESVLSLDAEACDAFFPTAYLPIVEEANKRTWYPWRAILPTPGNFEYHRAIARLDRYVIDIVSARADKHLDRLLRTGSAPLDEQAMQSFDILDRIIAACYAEQAEPNAVPRALPADRLRQLRDEVKTFVFAGHETSSMMITWTMYQLLKNPECLAKVKAEADAVFSEYESHADDADREQYEPDFRAYSQLVYTQNALKEALRLYSIVPVVTRQVLEDDMVGDYFLPRDAKLVLCIQAVHHNEKYWDAPYEFRPERFETNYHPYAFLPFINGPRRCIGQFFALLETKIVLALLVKRFNFSIAPECKGEKHPFNVPVCPIDNLPVLVE